MQISTSRCIKFGVIFLPLIILWHYPLFRGFDGDEPISAWVTQGAFAEMLQRSFEFQAQFPFYFILLWLWHGLFGDAEAVSRLLSIVFAIGTSVTIFQIGKQYLEKQFYFLPLLILFSSEQFIITTFSVRPYAQALFFATLSVLLFIRVLKNPSNKNLLLYSLVLCCTWYTHYLFILILIVHLLLWYTEQKSTLLTVKKHLCSCVFAAVLCLPSLYHIQIWRSKQSMLSNLSAPTLKKLALGIVPLQLATYLFLSFALVAIFWSFSLKRKTTVKDLPFLLWWIAPPVLLFIFSYLLGSSLLSERYYLWQVPGIALTLSLLIAAVTPEKSARNIIIIYLLAAIFLEVQRDWRIQDWRGAAAAINQYPASEKILVYTGLIEAEQQLPIIDTKKNEYLLVPFAVYPVSQKLIPISLAQTPTLELQQRVILVALRQLKVELRPPQYVADILLKRIEKMGFKVKSTREFGQVTVTELEQLSEVQ